MTWRQHCLALAGVLPVLGGLALYLLFNGLAMHHAYASLGLMAPRATTSRRCLAEPKTPK